MAHKKLIADLPTGVGVTRAVNGSGAKFFKVRFGKKFTRGPVRVKCFTTLADARKYLFGDPDLHFVGTHQAGPDSGLLGLHDKVGPPVFALTPAQWADATWAFQQLGGQPLTDAIKYYLKHAQPTGGLKRMSEVIKEHLASMVRRKRSESYRKAQEIACNVLQRGLKDPPINTVRHEAIEIFADGRKWKDLNKHNYYRDWSMLFNFAVRKEYTAENPLKKLDWPTVERGTPEIFTVEEAANVLFLAQTRYEPILPFVVIGLFAGLRVSELRRLRWEMVGEDFISVPVGVAAKKGEHREIEIRPNLRKWLRVCREEIGSIAPHDDRWYTEKLYREAAVKKRNALRHSFASYFLADTNSPEKTQLALGQQTPSVLFKHYRVAVKPPDAKRYWSLTPRNVKRIAALNAQNTQVPKVSRSASRPPTINRGIRTRIRKRRPR